MMHSIPVYLELSEKDWEKKLKKAWTLFSKCQCCPRGCLVNRIKGETGFCGAGSEMIVASSDAHFGEEPPISGWRGSGTIFFTYCPMRCIYCQNYPFSQLGQGRSKSVEALACMMTELQQKCCHNINLVTPAHFVPQILQSLRKAVSMGLAIPIVYNTSSFESPEILSLLDGIVDIYLADMRYYDPEKSARYSSAKQYPQISRRAIKEMYRQVGCLVVDESGIARRGLIIRHLILPNRIAGSKAIFSFIANKISPNIPISLMSQYYPAYKASNYPELNRLITDQEYKEALDLLEELGLVEGWRQDL